MNRLLKLDPSNIDLLKQKQDLLAKAVEQCAKKLEELKKAQQAFIDNGGDINSDGVLDVRDCTGPGPEGIHTSDINTWVSWQTDNIFGDGYQQPGFVGWVFPLQ